MMKPWAPLKAARYTHNFAAELRKLVVTQKLQTLLSGLHLGQWTTFDGAHPASSGYIERRILVRFLKKHISSIISGTPPLGVITAAFKLHSLPAQHIWLLWLAPPTSLQQTFSFQTHLTLTTSGEK